MPQTASRSIDESALTKMQLRKLNALRKSVGDDIGERAFAEWLTRQATVERDRNVELIADSLWPLVEQGELAPVHGRKFRIGVAAPAAVVQPQGGQRHAQAPTCPSEGRSRVHPPPMSDGHSRISVGPRRRALYGCRALGLDDTA